MRVLGQLCPQRVYLIAPTSPCDNIDHVSFPSLCVINSQVRKVHVRKVAHPYHPKVVISEEIVPIAPTSPSDNINFVFERDSRKSYPNMRTCLLPVGNKRDTCTSLKAQDHRQDHGPHANDHTLTASSNTSYNRG